MTEEIFRYFPSSLRKELEAETSFPMAEELRLRAGKRAMFYAEGEEHILRIRPDKQEIADILLALSQHSLHSFSDELRQGFFTMEGGIRIGVAGKAVSERGSIRLIRSFSSMNIRFPREKIGVQKKLAPHIRHEGNILNTLIISAPQHGKTTLLRDIVRAVSDGEDGYRAKKMHGSGRAVRNCGERRVFSGGTDGCSDVLPQKRRARYGAALPFTGSSGYR